VNDLRSAVDILYADFAWAIDRGVPEMLGDIFEPDAVYATGGHTLVGVDAIRRRFAGRSGGRSRITRHTYSGLRLRITDPDSSSSDQPEVHATSVWTCFAANGAEPPVGVPPLYMVADFSDRLRLGADHRWRIAERVITPVFHDPAAAPRE